MSYESAHVGDSSAGAPQTGRFIAGLRRYWWIVVSCTVVGAIVAFAIAETTTKQYSSTAALLFQQSDLDQELFGFSTFSAVDPTTIQATNLELVTQPAVATAAAATLGVKPAEVESAVSAAAAGATDVVTVTATAPSPRFAARLVNVYVRQFVRYQQQSDRAQVVQSAQNLRLQIQRIAAGGGSKAELRNLRTRLSQLEVLEALQTGDVQVVQTGQVPTSPTSPKKGRDTGLGLVAGLLVGLLFAGLATQLDQRLRDEDEIRELVRLPLLGVIPRTEGLATAGNGPYLLPPVEAEPFRLLRTQLQYFNVDRPIKTILIVSAQSDDGKSTVAWNLAREAAVMRPDTSVLLVDADLRRPVQATTAGVAPAPGLAEFLSQDLLLQDVMRVIPVNAYGSEREAELTVLPAGAVPPNPHELLDSNKMRTLLHQLEETHHLIVIDASPPLLVSDSIPLLRQVSGVIVVARLGQTRRVALRRLMEQMHGIGAHTIGLVINDVRDRRKTGYYGYGYAAKPSDRELEVPSDAVPHE